MCNSENVIQTNLPFFGTQIINPFLNSMMSDNHDKEVRKTLYPFFGLSIIESLLSVTY